MTIDELCKIIEERKTKMPENSYVASLLRGGKDQILQKIGEEATEVIIAAKNENKKEIVFEVADLLFHVLVLLSYFNIKPDDIFDELESRKK